MESTGWRKRNQKYIPVLFVELTDSFLKSSGSSAKQLTERIYSWVYSIFHAEDGQEILPNKILKIANLVSFVAARPAIDLSTSNS